MVSVWFVQAQGMARNKEENIPYDEIKPLQFLQFAELKLAGLFSKLARALRIPARTIPTASRPIHGVNLTSA